MSPPFPNYQKIVDLFPSVPSPLSFYADPIRNLGLGVAVGFLDLHPILIGKSSYRV